MFSPKSVAPFTQPGAYGVHESHSGPAVRAGLDAAEHELWLLAALTLPFPENQTGDAKKIHNSPLI
jgi:hypothetical protein